MILRYLIYVRNTKGVHPDLTPPRPLYNFASVQAAFATGLKNYCVEYKARSTECAFARTGTV